MSLSVSAGSLDDNDDLLHLLTQSWDEESKNAVQTSQWTRDYLHRLTSLPLNELLNEPKELRHEQDKMQREAKQLAFRDYPCFIYAQSCRHQVDETLKGLDHQLTDFATTIPALQDACDTFLQEAGAVMGERSKITRVLEHQNVLVELLEIPQLMETCVLNGYYSEAMDLASHVRLLHLRYPLPVIDTIQDQVKSYSDLMLMQLLSHLRRPIKLAAAMNIIGYLRRLDTFQTENELRMVFLRCRHSFLEQRVDRIKREMSDDTRKRSQDAVDYLKKYIDIMREQMFEIATQYLSVFSNEEQDSLLSDYMVHLTLDIRTTLSEYLGMVQDVSSLASLLTQLQYCGMSLGRIGLDFRHFFVHIFEETVKPLILRWIDGATSDLVGSLTKAATEQTLPSAWMSTKLNHSRYNDHDEKTSSAKKSHTFHPPMLLMDYPSLALFTNSVLSIFNALRLMPAISLFKPLETHLDACFMEIESALRHYADLPTSSLEDEAVFVQSYESAYTQCCVPFLRSCLVDGIYGDIGGIRNSQKPDETQSSPERTSEIQTEQVVEPPIEQPTAKSIKPKSEPSYERTTGQPPEQSTEETEQAVERTTGQPTVESSEEKSELSDERTTEQETESPTVQDIDQAIKQPAKESTEESGQPNYQETEQLTGQPTEQ